MSLWNVAGADVRPRHNKELEQTSPVTKAVLWFLWVQHDLPVASLQIKLAEPLSPTHLVFHLSGALLESLVTSFNALKSINQSINSFLSRWVKHDHMTNSLRYDQ